jgi:hypothetical protein
MAGLPAKKREQLPAKDFGLPEKADEGREEGLVNDCEQSFGTHIPERISKPVGPARASSSADQASASSRRIVVRDSVGVSAWTLTLSMMVR